MVTEKKISVEVAYATPMRQKIIALQVDMDCSILDAVQQSGILEVFPEINLAEQKVGVFSQTKKLSDILHNGDRVEIYRPLTMDPKEARKKRVSR